MTGPGPVRSDPAVTVLVFAAYAEALGVPDVQVVWRDGLTAGDVVDHLRGLPGGSSLPTAPLLAVNQRYADLRTPVGPDDEVALIPPVAGG